jgi:hypothetical protein
LDSSRGRLIGAAKRTDDSETAMERKDADIKRAIQHDQQYTGSHDKPPAERGGTDRFGGSRAGAENVEPTENRNAEKVDGAAQAERISDANQPPPARSKI